MELTALLVLAGFGVLAFGVRTVLHHRRTGDAGFRGLSGRPGSAGWWAGILLIVASLAAPVGPVAGWAGMPAVPFLDTPWVAALGLVLAVLGVVAAAATQAAMGDTWRVGVDEHEQTALITTGMFALVRNPFFTATAAVFIGVALMVPNLISIGAAVALTAAVEMQVRLVEEPALREHHGDTYADYVAHVGRFLPSARHGARRTER